MRIPRLALLVAGLAALAACSSPSQQPSTATDVPPVPTVAAQGHSASAAGTGGAVGPGCATLPLSDDPGSLANMSLQPVAAAVESNPELSTLHELILDAGLTEQLNTAPGLTVFAPTNAAFDALPATELQQLRTNRTELAALLEYHVADRRESAAQLLAAGTSQQQAGGTVRIGGTAEELTVTDGAGTLAHVLCGDVATENATVFLVDTVLQTR